MVRDLRIALRSLSHQPGFVGAVVLTLGLGLGANAALFTLVDAVMLRALPYTDDERLVAIYETVQRGDTAERRTVSYPDFEAIRDEVTVFDAVAVWATTSYVVTGGERAVRLRGERVSADYFEVLGVEPIRGGGFTGDDAPQVILGYDLWQTTYGGDPEILGQTLNLGSEPHHVVGVMPEGFEGIMDGRELWTQVERLSDNRRSRDNRFLGAVARLAPDATIEQANTQIGTVFARLETEFPDDNAGYSAVATSLQDELVGDFKRPVQVLLVAVGLLLLIACANVANLLLVRRVRQRRQAAIRLALGAGTRDLMRWSLVEVVVLGLVGGALGLLFATWSLAGLSRISPVELPSYATIGVNGQVVFFAMILALVVSAVLGAATALQIRHGSAEAFVRLGGSTTVGRGGGARRWLLAAEIALALIVATGAVSTVASWHTLTRVDPGFEPEAAIFRVTLPDLGDESPAEPDPALDALRRRIVDEIAALPGVETVALSSGTPLEGGYSGIVISPEGAEPRPGEPYGGGFRTYRHVVSKDYFDALGIPLVRGDGFDDVRAESLPVAVISRRLAERLWPGESNPLGRRFLFGRPPSAEDLEEISAAAPEDSPWITVAGLVGEVRHRNLVPNPERMAEDPDLYLPLDQWPRRSLAGIVRLTDGEPAAILPEVRQRLEAVHAEMPVYAMRTLADDLTFQTSRSRFGTVLMALFAVLSVALAALGIYGVMAYRVSERTREIGIRMALGADRRLVVRRVLREGMATAGIGLLIGCGIAFFLARAIDAAGVLYGIDAADLRIIVPTVALLTAVAFAACVLPARRASRVDPLVALRDE
ncbi:MAG: ADOP family duplicated permease [Acidobacteriota bacterium]